jgi:hypothetical protein
MPELTLIPRHTSIPVFNSYKITMNLGSELLSPPPHIPLFNAASLWQAVPLISISPFFVVVTADHHSTQTAHKKKRNSYAEKKNSRLCQNDTKACQPKFLFSGKYQFNYLMPFLSGFLWTRVYATLLLLPPLRFHCVGGCWDCSDFYMAVMRYNHSARSYQRLQKLSSSTLTNLIHKKLVFVSFYLIKVKQE